MSPERYGLKACPDLWFEDGNIIIRAENTLFKVYIGILRRQSEIFNDLLTLPQPSDAEIIEDCHVVRLEGTSARDVRLFLLCLHDPAEYHKAMANFEDVALLLRMSHKYIATALEERILAHLSHMFPSTFEQFDLSEQDSRKLAAPFDYTSPACNIAIANAAHEIGALRILPIALYRLCRCKTDELLYTSLSSDNLRSVLVGRSRLSAYAREATYSYLFAGNREGAPDQYAYGSCCRVRRSELAVQLVNTDGWLDPLAQWNQHTGLCKQCEALAKRYHSVGQARTWAKLPEFFALPAWARFLSSNEVTAELYSPRRPAPVNRSCSWTSIATLAVIAGGLLWYFDALPTISIPPGFPDEVPSWVVVDVPSSWAMLLARVL